MEMFAFDTPELALLSAAGILLTIQLVYYFGLYNRIHARNVAVKKGKVEFSEELPPLSVILPACDEAESLRETLPAILEQDYPLFEVIVINDASTDETEEVLAEFEKKYPNLYHSFTPDSARYISHKKLALTLGIKASKYEWLVFTETDCTPASGQWLRLMARNFTPQTQIVLGHIGYKRPEGRAHKEIALDMLFRSMRYLGFALSGKPYMGIGRNMAYRKELFFKQKGFSAHLNLRRGEDDLFVNQTATGENTRVETDREASVLRRPVNDRKEWKEETMSYAVTSRYYRGPQRYLCGLETTSRLLLYGACAAGIAYGAIQRHWIAAATFLLAWSLRYAIQALIVNRTARETGERGKFYLLLPALDLLQPLRSLKAKIRYLFQSKEEFMRR